MKKRSIFISLGVILAVSIIIFVIFMNKEEPDIICMVGFDNNGGSSVETQYIKKGDTATKPISPVKEGYKFLYWSYNTEEFDFNTPITEDIILLAEYQKKLYTIAFNTVGGSSIDKQKVEHGSNITKPANPTKTGYEFLYWTYNGEKYNFSKPVTQYMTLVAKWKEVYHTVTFDYDNKLVSFVDVLEGSCVEVPDEPIKPGYEFVCWEYRGKDQEFDFNTPIYEDIKLIARWKPID